MTKEKYGGCQRQLAWFSRQKGGLYFEVFAFFGGSHTSYHRDGNIFRTSPATNYHATPKGKYLPLDGFKGWHQLGIMMANKDTLLENPCVGKHHRKTAITLQEIGLKSYPSVTINFVVELLESNGLEFITSEDAAPPPDAKVYMIDSIQPWIVLTVLGYEHNLLVKPCKDGVTVSHFNIRYSANRPGVKYEYEAYSH